MSRKPEDRRLTIAERVEGHLYGDICHREGDFESIAADILKMSQSEVDEALRLERQAKALDREHEKSTL